MARKQFSNEFKAKVALEALKGEKAIAQLSAEYGVHASQDNTWKQPDPILIIITMGAASWLTSNCRK